MLNGWRSGLLSVGYAVLTVAASAAQVSPAQPGPGATVVVSGAAELELPPDEAEVRLGVVAQAAEAQDAQNQVSTTAQRVLEAIRALGIAGRNVQTTGLNLHPYYDDRHLEQGQPSIAGYQASNIVLVVVEELDKVGPVIDAAIKAGANNVDSLQFTIGEDADARRLALSQAVADAGLKASAIAGALGREVGDVIEVVEQGASVMPKFFAQSARLEMAQASTPVEPGSVTVSANVTIRYQIR
jgi:hypothetical protein